MPVLKVTNRLWIISDTHFGHKNIIRYAQRPETHEIIMLSEWIWAVPEDAQILHMGDVLMGSMGNSRRWASVIERLPGEKFLLLGNHDTKPPEFYEGMGFKIVLPFVKNGYAFTHRPIAMNSVDVADEWHTNIHGHTHANVYTREHDGELYADKHYINVCVEQTDLAPRQLGTIWRPDEK